MPGALADSLVVAVKLARIAAWVERRGGVVQASGCGQPKGMSRVREPKLKGKSHRHPQALVVGGVAEGQGEWRSGRGRRRHDRAVRGGPLGEPLSAVESDVVGVVFPRAGPGSGDTQEGQEGWDQGARHTECRRSGRASGGGGGVGAQRGAGVPRGLLRLSSRALARGRGRGLPGAVFQEGLGCRS